jgi:hypothetical protein
MKDLMHVLMRREIEPLFFNTVCSFSPVGLGVTHLPHRLRTLGLPWTSFVLTEVLGKVPSSRVDGLAPFSLHIGTFTLLDNLETPPCRQNTGTALIRYGEQTGRSQAKIAFSAWLYLYLIIVSDCYLRSLIPHFVHPIRFLVFVFDLSPSRNN